MSYSKKFHERRTRQPEKYATLAAAVLDAFFEASSGLYPALAVDVGCSAGMLLKAVGEALGCRLHGIDHALPAGVRAYEGGYTECDLNTGEPKGHVPMGDLVICQEVLEHIDPANTMTALQVVDRAAAPGAVLVFGAGHPGQRGTHHVNCRPVAEWAALLGELGWREHAGGTGEYQRALRRGGLGEGCYMDNTRCYIKKD